MTLQSAKRLVKLALNKSGYRIASTSSYDMFEAAVARFDHPDFTFIQVGANDGKRFDPIFAFATSRRWKGYAIEPIREYYEELVQNYSKFPRVTCCNVAIFDHDGPLDLYRVRPGATGVPEWSKGIASVFDNHHRKSGIPSNKIAVEQVRGQSWRSFLAAYKISRFDLLQIDAEGYDFQILRMLDLNAFSPSIIRFEHGIADGVMDQSDFAEISYLLVQHGYHLHVGQYDCCAAKLSH